MNEIKIFETELISRNKLKVDSQNPNKMNDSMYRALKNSIAKFGIVYPIITNKKLVIADGFHRFKAARELGLDKIKIIKLDVDEVDRRLLRQLLNKIKGKHDPILDEKEFKFLNDNNAITEIMNYLPNERETIKNIVDNIPSVENTADQVDKLYSHLVKCPECGHEFEKKKKVN